jgi:hypothetical protein
MIDVLLRGMEVHETRVNNAHIQNHLQKIKMMSAYMHIYSQSIKETEGMMRIPE